ncbi:MAG: outer membrane protein transport protein [Lentisphaeraceae bacterium]|nr:outer membrane protein transport protein [Lentisphaeraceae bacterium]
MGFRIAVILIVFSCCTIATDGTSFSGHGPKQVGTAGAGVANPQDSTWLNLNPAGIVKLKNTFDISYEYLRPNRKTEMSGILGNSAKDQDTGKSFIPNISMVYELDEDSRFGLGLFTVAGVNNHMSNSRTTTGAAGGFDKNVDYYSLKLNAVYARKLSNGWSIGFGPSIVFSRLRSDMADTTLLSQTKGQNEWDESWGGGFVFGLYKEWDWGAFGLNYSSRQWTETFNKYDDAILTPLDHPQYAQVGFSFKLTEDLDWLIDYKWIDWDSIGQIGRSADKAGFGWSDSHIIKTGFIWRVTEETTLRCGYSYGRSPVQDNDQLANSLFPAITEHHASVGMSHKINDSWEVSVSYLRAFKSGVRENNKDVVAGGGSTSSLELDFIALGVSWYF